MESKYLLVVVILLAAKTVTAPSTGDLESGPTSTHTSSKDVDSELELQSIEAADIGEPLQRIANAEAAVVHNGNPVPVPLPVSQPKRVIYINQCSPDTQAQVRTTTTRKPFSELDSPPLQDQTGAGANKNEIEFSTNTTIYRLRIMDTMLTCTKGVPPTIYQSRGEGSGSQDKPNEDDYYFYDDDHELAALVHDRDDDDPQADFIKLIQNPSPLPESQGLPAPAAAANTVPNPNQNNEHDLYIATDGRLQVDTVFYDIEDYCIASFKGPTVKVFACDQVCAPPEFPCIRKCCEFGSTFDIGQGSCTKSNRSVEWSPTFYEVPNVNMTGSSTGTNRTKKPQFQIQMPSGCSHGFDIWPFEFGDNLQLRGLQEYTKLRLLPDGSIHYFTRSRKWYTLNSGVDDFCVESGELIPDLAQNQMVIKCSHASYSQEIGVITLLIAVLYSVGSVFLAIITTLFILLWDDTSNIHTWAVFIEIVILLLHYITLTSIYYLILNVNSTFWILGSSPCVVLGAFSHFTYISIFSWMAILNYDFWVTFSTKNKNEDPSLIATSKLRFFVYFLLGFGAPGLVIGLGLLLDHLFADPDSGVLVPSYGQYFACTMSRWAEGAYTYFPIGLLYIVSLVYIIRIHYLINETKNSRNSILWRPEAEQEKTGPAGRVRLDKYWCYRMLFNVSIICGLTWIVQIISFIVFHIKSNAGDTTISAAGTSLIYVSISDLVVGIQPLGICIIFLIQDRVWKQLTTKYGLCRRFDKQINEWTAAGAGKLSRTKPVVAKKQLYNLARARTEGATQEEMISMMSCCKEAGPTIDSVIPTMDYLDGNQKRADESPQTSIESISYKCLPDPDRETNV